MTKRYHTPDMTRLAALAADLGGKPDDFTQDREPTWAVRAVYNPFTPVGSAQLAEFLKDRWEPFAVDAGIMFVRRRG